MEVLRRMSFLKSMPSSNPPSPLPSTKEEDLYPTHLSISVRSLNFGSSEDDVDTIFPQQLCDSSLLVDESFLDEESIKTEQCKTPQPASSNTPSTTPSPSKCIFPISIFLNVEAHNISREESKKLIAESASDPKLLLGWQVEIIGRNSKTNVRVVKGFRKLPFHHPKFLLISPPASFSGQELNSSACNEEWIKLHSNSGGSHRLVRVLRKVYVEQQPETGK